MTISGSKRHAPFVFFPILVLPFAFLFLSFAFSCAFSPAISSLVARGTCPIRIIIIHRLFAAEYHTAMLLIQYNQDASNRKGRSREMVIINSIVNDAAYDVCLSILIIRI